LNPYFENIFLQNHEFKFRSLENTSLLTEVRAHPHSHNEVEILLFKIGNATQQVSDKYFTVSPGDIVIIGKNQLHSTYSFEDSTCEVLVLQFDIESFLTLPPKSYESEIRSLYNNDMLFKNPIDSSNSHYYEIKSIILKIAEEYLHRNQSYQTAIKALILSLSSTLARANISEPNSNYFPSNSLNVLSNTFALIDNKYQSPISLKEAAAASNLSIPQFCRIFKKTTGKTLIEYITYYRINMSLEMLKNNKTQIEITYECGFGSISSYIRSFRKIYNCTPKEFYLKKP